MTLCERIFCLIYYGAGYQHGNSNIVLRPWNIHVHQFLEVRVPVLNSTQVAVLTKYRRDTSMFLREFTNSGMPSSLYSDKIK